MFKSCSQQFFTEWRVCENILWAWLTGESSLLPTVHLRFRTHHRPSSSYRVLYYDTLLKKVLHSAKIKSDATTSSSCTSHQVFQSPIWTSNQIRPEMVRFQLRHQAFQVGADCKVYPIFPLGLATWRHQLSLSSLMFMICVKLWWWIRKDFFLAWLRVRGVEEPSRKGDSKKTSVNLNAIGRS